jgi:hypothetical protein
MLGGFCNGCVLHADAFISTRCEKEVTPQLPVHLSLIKHSSFYMFVVSNSLFKQDVFVGLAGIPASYIDSLAQFLLLIQKGGCSYEIT